MVNGVLKMGAVWTAAAVAVGYYFTLDEGDRISLADLLGQEPAVEAVEPAPPKPRTRPAPPASASMVSIPRRNGQFFTRGTVNRGHVEFLVDTGASAVALTAQDARKAGLDLQTLRYNVSVSTANGQTRAARVVLEEVRLGGIVLRDVEALVVPQGLHISLLGMTFLGELQKVEATPQQLILRL